MKLLQTKRIKMSVGSALPIFVAACLLTPMNAMADGVSLNTLINQPSYMSIDSSGQTTADPKHWSIQQMANSTVYSGRDSDPDVKHEKVEVMRQLVGGDTAMTDIIDVLPLDGTDGSVIKKVIQGKCTTYWTGQSCAPSTTTLGMPPLLVSVTHMGTGADSGLISSQTQCARGSCINVSTDSCNQFFQTAGVTSFDDLTNMTNNCLKMISSLGSVMTKLNDAEQASFTRDINTLKNSNVFSTYKTVANDKTAGFSIYSPTDLTHQFSRVRNFVDGCKMIAANHGVSNGSGSAPAPSTTRRHGSN